VKICLHTGKEIDLETNTHQMKHDNITWNCNQTHNSNKQIIGEIWS